MESPVSNRRARLPCAALAFCLACGSALAAAVVYVAPDGRAPEAGGDGSLAHPYDLPSALSAASGASAEIRLLMSDSPYLLTASIAPHAKAFVGWNGATDAPAGRDGRDKVVLDGQGAVKVVDSANLNGSWRFADLTFRNGDPRATGCLIGARNVTGSCLVTNCVFRDTLCTNRVVEANVYTDANSLTFADCDFRDLTVEGWYGFVKVEGPNVSFDRCRFFGNSQTTPSNAYGSFGYGAADFTDCVISNNTGVGIGGFCLSRSTWTRCRFENNRNANVGTCVYALESGTCAVSDCTFVENACTAEVESSGGACFGGGYISGNSSSGQWFVTNSVFVGNVSHARGAVMALRNGGGSSVTFVGCGFTNNVSGKCPLPSKPERSTGGSVLALTGVQEMRLDRCAFVDNVTSGICAAVRAEVHPSTASALTNAYVRSCLFLRNRSFGSNGGSSEGAVYLAGTCSVDNCTFIGNVTDSNLYGALCVGGSATDGPAKAVSNCLFYDNAHARNGIKTDRYAACNADPSGDVRFWNCFSQYGFLPSGQGNLVGTATAPLDPSFVDAAADDWRLAKGSCCIDAGESKAWMTRGETDLQGLPRPRRVEGGAVDIGCYERRVTPGVLFLVR